MRVPLATADEKGYDGGSTIARRRPEDSRATSLPTVGPGCSEAPPSVAPLSGSTQERFCMKRASRAWFSRVWRCMMDVVYSQCCGLDVHKKTVAACLITSTEGPEPVKEIRTFRTMTADLLALADWLQQAGCSHVAMESTGVYWRPVYNLLEGQCELLVVQIGRASCRERVEIS